MNANFELINASKGMVDFIEALNYEHFISDFPSKEVSALIGKYQIKPKTLLLLGIKCIRDVLQTPGQNLSRHNITINSMLNQACYYIGHYLQDQGFNVIPQFTTLQNFNPPANWETIASALIPSKVVGVISGAGEIGINNLFIHKDHGAKVKLAIVITDADIDLKKEYKSNLRCDQCNKCIAHCPAGALSNKGINRQICWEYVVEIQKKWGYSGCGLCMFHCM